MKKLIFIFFDICLLIGAIIYSVFRYKKVIGNVWNFNNYRKIILIANGPSLNKDMKSNKSKESEVYVLNYFAVTIF